MSEPHDTPTVQNIEVARNGTAMIDLTIATTLDSIRASLDMAQAEALHAALDGLLGDRESETPSTDRDGAHPPTG